RLVRAHLRQTGRIGDTTTDRLLFMCAGPSYEELRFVRFTQQEGRQPRICSFGWEHARAGETRTVREMCLPKLRLGRDLFDAIQWDTALWEQAWDVEAVTREFFRGYHQVFDQLKLAVGKSVPDDGAAHLFTQRLLNRIMFCWFLQRRDWLNKQQDYLRALYEIAEDHRRSGGHGPRRPNYYRDYLWPLFFCALNTPWDARPCDDEWSLLSGVLGNVPYLNGGLFAPEEPLDSCDAVKLPNVAFEPVLSLFERFHFTITESTPDDTEVAVDPEMLGKVFEELITERHEKGSYYTPRPIVSFMCREAIKGYLNAHHELVDERRADAITVPEARELLERLAAIRVVDPACGSGAYLLGMLHELHDLTRLLDTRAQRADARGDYHRKLDIICNSIYGVDLDPFAVNIARLRLWLSLVVEFEGDNPPPLPNLDFKIEQGDSLLEPAQSGSSIRADIVAEYAQAKADYTRGPDSGDREHLAARVASLRGEIAHWHARGTAVFGLDWLVEFAEVAQRGGFDVVVANPPYVRQEELTTPCWQVLGVPKPEETAVPRGAGNPLLMPYKRALAATHGDVATGTADLYCYFYSRAVQLLKPGGVLAFISSNKWFRAKYGEKLRAYLADHCFTLSITDFGELPVFDAGTFPMIYIARRRTEAEMTAGTPSEPVFTQVKSLDPPYPDVAALIERDGQPLPPNAINKKVWLLTGASEAARIKKMEQAGVPLGVYVRNRIYYGIKTGFNEAFIIDQKKRDELIAADP
ncbi:MAG: hypothetical protein FJX72_17945, partial [Armatimonadetes bacterium]|nr:hypothetical protein [Armatimonadota bacterium]